MLAKEGDKWIHIEGWFQRITNNYMHQITMFYSDSQNEAVQRHHIIYSPEQTPAEAFPVETKKLLVPYRRLALTKPDLAHYKIQD